jgi:ribonucleoside-diphosphate reductase alpha chain
MCNPCSEIPLEDKELCNLMELFPVRAKSKKEWLRMCELGTMYTTSVSLLPTHNEETNAVIARNRRIGISICGVSDWFDKWGSFKIIRFMRAGYDHIKETAKFYNEQAGVPIPIRITTVKPSGTVSQLAGLSPGMHFPTHKFAIRRMRISETSPVLRILEKAGIPVEDEVNNKGTKVIEYPIYTGATRPISEVTAWEQFSLLALLQREWSDNMVSCTISFKEEEKNDLSRMLAHYIPLIKSVSLLPIKSGVYPQMPYEGITEKEYEKRVECLRPLDWSNFEGSDGKENKYCSNDSCEL